MAINIGKPHVGDVNTDFQLVCEETNVGKTANTVINLAGTTSVSIYFERPDRTILGPFTARIVTPPGTDGIIGYINGDSTLLSVSGYWKRWGKINFSDGGVFYTNHVIFQVLP